MVTVASKELKNRLGRYLRLVREGKPVRITDRGRPIGCILPLRKGQAPQETEALARLLGTGNLRLGAGRLGRRARPSVMAPGASVAEMVVRDRR